MWDQEKEHKKKFDELLPKYRTRPTAMLPIWNIAGFALGAGNYNNLKQFHFDNIIHIFRLLGSALFGPKMAMACTAAVETVITDHYNDQLRQLMENPTENKELLDIIRRFRDDEIEHHDTAIANQAEEAPLYKVVSQVIKLGCKGAIFISERV